ncbi:MAG: holo-ACP synthase [Planctomycetota bacterium]|nr:MAG: holo-ACP synthase [Planctomycetota bacterium]
MGYSDSPVAETINPNTCHNRPYEVTLTGVMDIVATGIDLIECKRIRDIWQRHGDRLTDRLLTEAEFQYVRRHKDPVPRLAGRFAAKEAVLKVLGTGWRGKIAWRDVEILNAGNGRPHVKLTGECKRIADQMGITDIFISITHTENYAVANAIGIGK